MIQMRNWPFAHPEIYHQNIEAVRSGAYKEFTVVPYNAFLLFPRAAVYDLYTPIPISNYSHLLQTSWWSGEFQKYGHDALKISSTRADQSHPLQSALSFRYNNFKALLSKLELPRCLTLLPRIGVYNCKRQIIWKVTYASLLSATHWE